jgi:putative FmdB family regulatory protein
MPIYEYECCKCGVISEFFEGMTQEQPVRKCDACGSDDLTRIMPRGVQSRMGQVMGSQGGKTCCGREDRCDTPPCAKGAACHK